MEHRRFRFGILGAGTIAHRFAREVAPVADLRAVTAPRMDRAKAFARSYGINKAYESTDGLLNDPEVDAIYVATPASVHYSHCLRAFKAGKPVLCEKPLTTTGDQAAELAAAARSAGVFCMEAMWMRFNPLIEQARAWIDSGCIGPVRTLDMTLGWRQPEDQDNRLLDPDRGGGALLDLGVYGLNLAQALLGTPTEATGFASFHQRGVDETASVLLRYPSALASLTCSIAVTPSNRAVITGPAGRIELEPPFFNPDRIRLVPTPAATRATPSAGSGMSSLKQRLPGIQRLRRSPLADWWRARRYQTVYPASVAAAFQGQALETMRCVREGRTESEIMPLDDSVAVMQLMDHLRSAWRTA